MATLQHRCPAGFVSSRAPISLRRGVRVAVQASLPGQPAPAPTLQRRAALAAAAVLALGVSGQAKPVVAAECELQTAPNGLQFCDLVTGGGNSPVAGAFIRAHYTGRLASNGAVFDSSYDRGRPLSFKVGVGQVIRGWDLGILGSEAEGIPPMKEGGKRKLVIPSGLAYGERGAGGLIPPNATLEFLVELLPPRTR